MFVLDKIVCLKLFLYKLPWALPVEQKKSDKIIKKRFKKYKYNA